MTLMEISMNVGNTKLGTKLISAFILTCAINSGVSAIGIYNMAKINENGAKVYRVDLVGLNLIQQAHVELLDAGLLLRNAILASNTARRATFLAGGDKLVATARGSLDKAEPVFDTENEKATFASLNQNWQEYTQVFNELKDRVSVASPEDRENLTAYLFTNFSQRTKKISELVDALVAVKQANAKGAAESNHATYDESCDLMIVLCVLSVTISVGIGVWMTLSVTRQLGTEPAIAANVAKSVAAGDLSVNIDLRLGDTSSVMASLKSMRDALLRVVLEVQGSAEDVTTASVQIAEGNQDLSSRTEEQAASLEETASTMEELTATVRHNADNARLAATLAGTASVVAQEGGEVIGRVVETMRQLSESSARMIGIVSVIEGIAFQTNILALNASVEAARAGEQGRGFAVVAGEVRTLAQRSAMAAKEVKELIGDSVRQVEMGSKLVEEGGGTIKEIVESVKRVTHIVGEISSASEEQSTGIEQVNQAVSQMDQVTQQNAALVDEVSAAAQSMSQQARGLREAVAYFKVGDSELSASRMIAPSSELLRPALEVRRFRPTTLTKPGTAGLVTAAGNTGVEMGVED